jgi:hypothetical protein
LTKFQGAVLRKLALFASACIFLFATRARAQHIDIAIGGGTLLSSTSTSTLVNFQPPPEHKGTYVNVSADLVKFKHRLGFNVESAWSFHQVNYDGYESYRPVFTDVNGLFQPQITKKISLDLMGGIGVASTRFYLAASCGTPGCVNYTSSNHFMEDLGIGLRYYVWHRIPRVFVRPEARYYHVQDNFEFHSGNLLRVGASVGYTFGSR